MNYKLIGYAGDFVSFLLQHLGERANKIKSIILFGSIVRGEESRESDIDIFIDVTDKNIETQVEEIKGKFYQSVKVKRFWELFDIKNEIHCTVGKLEEWGDLKKSLVMNGVLLFGKYQGTIDTEPYYLFKVNPGKERKKNVAAWRALYGYTQKVGKKEYVKQGLVQEYEGKRLARGVFMVPITHAQKISAFLRKNAFTYEIIPFWQGK